jgi:hypothetical protein
LIWSRSRNPDFHRRVTPLPFLRERLLQLSVKDLSSVVSSSSTSWQRSGSAFADRNTATRKKEKDDEGLTFSLTGDTRMTIKIVPNDKGNPPGKLADAELHFTEGPLEGLKLIGFAVWERKTGNGRNVTFPARQYSVNGERRSFALLRPVGDAAAQNRIRDLVLQAYAEHEAEAAVTR